MFIQCPNLMNLSRVLNPQNPVSTARRLKSWNIEHNFKWNQPCLSHVSNLSRGLNSLNSASGFLKLILLKTNHEENVKIERCYCSTFWPRSSSSFDFMHQYEKSKFNRLNIRKIRIYDLTHIRILREIYFCLRWKSGRHNSTFDTKRPGNPVLHNTVSLFCSPYVYLTHYFLYNLKCIFISSIYSAIMANNRKAFMYT